MVKGSNNEECFYYYESGSTITVDSSLINYYSNITGSENIVKTEIFLVDNELFNNNSQLIKSYKTRECSENFLTQELNNPTKIFDFDTTNDIGFESYFTTRPLDIVSFNNSSCKYEGDSDILVNLVLKSITIPNYQIYLPLYLRKYDNIPLPKIQFTLDSSNYESSIIPILITNWTSTILISDLTIGTIETITSEYNINTLSSNLIITKNTLTEYTIKIKSGYTIPEYTIGDTTPYIYTPWSLQLDVSDGRTLIFYFWVVFVNDKTINNDIFSDFKRLSGFGFAQPLNVDTSGNVKISNILSSFELKNENIFKKDLNLSDIILNVDKRNYNIGYKYYDNVRNIDIVNNVHEILPLNFNGALNIKPKIFGFYYQFVLITDFLYEYRNNKIFQDAIYLIISYVSKETMKTVITIEPIRPLNTLENRLLTYETLPAVYQTRKINSLSLLVSYQNPLFIKNKIVLVQLSDKKFTITTYEKLYLEKNEIINIEGNYFVVKGLNIFTKSYDLESLYTITNKIKYLNNGYYTYGVYTSKEEKEFEIPNPNNIICFNKTKKIDQGEMYLLNNKLIVSPANIGLETIQSGSLYGTFTEKLLKVKLFYSNNKFYLCDNFIKIKKFDKMLLKFSNTEIIFLTVINIRDYEIIFDTLITLSTNNIFYEFILAYQPLSSLYVNIDSVGNIITNEIIDDEMTIGITNSVNTNEIDLYLVSNKKLNTNTWENAGNYWIYLLKTDYKKEFSNCMNIPKNNSLTIKNQHPICINVTYEKINNRFKLDDPTFLINGFIWFYGQPIKIYGLYTFIKNITIEIVNNIENYYIFIKDDINTLLENLSDEKLSSKMLISYSVPNMLSFYFYNKFRYNYGIQLNDYDMPDGTLINVVRCALKNDELIFITTKQNNKKIVFKYGISIAENERLNFIGGAVLGYKNVYFYNYRMINSDGYISNFDTLIGTYFLISEKLPGIIMRIYLGQIKPGNIIKNYTEYNFPNSYSYNLSKLIGIKSHFNGEFSYTNQQIVVSELLSDKNMSPIIISKKYQIKFKGITENDNGNYKHEIKFISTIVETNIYDIVYLDENFTLPVNIVKIIVSNVNRYYLLYNKILSNNIIFIYTKNTNFVLSSLQANKKFKNKNLNDDSLDFYINTQILNREDYVQNLLILKISQDDYKYKFKLVDGLTTILEIENKNTINTTYSTIKSIDNNNNIITTEYFIDTNSIELSNDYTKVDYYYGVTIDVSNVFDELLLFNSVKNLRLKLFEKCSIKLSIICNYLKPWNKWALLSSSNYVYSLKSLLNTQCCVKWNGSDVIISFNNGTNYGNITKSETYILSEFIKSVNKSAINLANYKKMKNDIEPFICKLLDKLLFVPEFYLNVIDNINNILNSFGFDVYFDGNNIIFNNDKNPQYILIDNENEIPYYLSNEYTYIESINTVFRDINSYNQISNQILQWINKSELIELDKILFGVGINKLLRYINIFGNQLKILFEDFVKPFSDTPNYYYINAIKFMVGKIWEKYSNNGNLINLEKEFTDKLISTVNFNINTTNNYDLLTFNYLFKIGYYGFINYNGYKLVDYVLPFTDINISDVINYKPYSMISVIQTNSLIINPVYKYKLNFTSNEILSNCTYTLDFLNGDKINTNVDIGNISIYPDQISFSSSYNIKPNDFYILKQQKIYNIISTRFLGFLYNVKFDSKYDVKLVDEIFLNGNNLILNNINKSDNTIDLLILDDNVSSTDVFEFRNYEFVKEYNISNNRIYIKFADPFFPFLNNQTLIIIGTDSYFLHKDVSNSEYYIDLVDLQSSNSFDVIITTQCICESIELSSEVLFEYQLDPPINDDKYRPINNNYIVPLEFSILNANYLSTNQLEKIQPLHVHTYGDNKIVFHYTNNQYYDLINTNNKFVEIVHKKQIVVDLSNKIVLLEKQNEFLYYVNVKYPMCKKTTGYIYYVLNEQNYDISPLDGILEPKIYPEMKTSISFIQINNSTFLSIAASYTEDQLKNNVGFIHKNEWDILELNYTISNDALIFTMPDDFLLLKLANKTYYKIGNILIPSSDINNYGNKLIINWNVLNGDLSGTIKFKQYFIEDIGTVFKPLENRKYKVTLEYPYQYLPTTNFYMYQYDSNGSKFDNYLYLIETSETTSLDGYFQAIAPNKTMQLIANNKVFIVKILDKIGQNNKICYIISYSEKLDLTTRYIYHLNNYIMNLVSSIKYYQNSLQFAKFYSQTELNSVNLFMNESVNNFKVAPGVIPIINPTKFYLVSYEKSELTNLFYSNDFKQNLNMIQKIEYNEKTITTNQIPEWEDYSKFFSSIKLYFNEQKVEELNENVYAIDKYLYSTDEKRYQKNKMCEIKFDGKKWTFYLPLIFWYSLKSGLSIPVVAMPHTEIILKYTLNDITNVLSNNLTNSSDIKYSFSRTPIVNLTLLTDFILLDNMERQLFGNHAHEYIIDHYKNYPDTYITNEDSIVKCNFKGLIKDIHLITRPSSNKKITYYPNIKTNYDAKYHNYIKAYNYYLDIVSSGKYKTEDQRNYVIDIEIIRLNETKLSLYKISQNKEDLEFIQINKLTNWFNTWSIFNEDLLKYLMYYETKFLSFITLDKRKEYILTIYLKYQFSNNYTVETISPIESLVFKVNGSALFAERDYTYFTDVIPYQKFKNSLPIGYYTYTFSLNPCEDQHSGHLNFSNFDDIVIKVKSNPLVNTDQFSLSTIVKEYNILRIMSGHSSLAWL